MKPEAPNAPTRSCPDIEILLGRLDGELDASRRAALDAHVDTCPKCAQTVRELEARSQYVSAWLAKHDPAVPDRSTYDLRLRAGTPFWRRRWAIVIGVVVAVAVAAGPARAWLLGHLGLTRARVTQTTDDRQSPTTATSFVPQGSIVTVGFDAGVRGRTLMVTRSADSRASLDGTASSAEVVVRPDGFDVHDAHQSPLAYRLSVPSTVTTVRVKVDGAEDVVVHPEPSVQVVAIPAGGR
jgi:anti-sigma factor RsiW